jgi:hypothetical protein
MIGLNAPPQRKLVVSMAVAIAALSEGRTKNASRSGRSFIFSDPVAIVRLLLESF